MKQNQLFFTLYVYKKDRSKIKKNFYFKKLGKSYLLLQLFRLAVCLFNRDVTCR